MPPTSEQLWDAIYSIYNEDGAAEKIQPAVIAKRIEFKNVGLGATGLPHLAAYGAKCHIVMEGSLGAKPLRGAFSCKAR